MEYIQGYIYYLNKNEISKTSSKDRQTNSKKKKIKKIIVVAGACLNDEWIKVH